MKMLIKAHGPTTTMAVADIEPAKLLAIMNNWPKIDDLLSLNIVDVCDWYNDEPRPELDDANVTDFEEPGDPVIVECQTMVVTPDAVYWRGQTRDGETVDTNAVGRRQLEELHSGR